MSVHFFFNLLVQFLVPFEKTTLLKPSEENLVPSLAKRLDLTVINRNRSLAVTFKSSLITLKLVHSGKFHFKFLHHLLNKD